MYKKLRKIAVLVAAGVLFGPSISVAQTENRITVLYDAFGKPSELKKDWGFSALVEVNGKRVALQLGGSPANLGGVASAGTGDKIVLTSVSGGHFVTSGTVNGSAVRFFVDTGATTIAMGVADAERIGLDYKRGQLGYTSTANGVIPAYKVMLSSVRIGDVQVYNVEATVLPSSMPYLLLGNSFLDRFQMRRENDRLTLEKK